MNPLDLPLIVTFFEDHAAQTKRSESLSLRQIGALVQRTTAPEKRVLPWLKLADFGDERTKRGSLRSNANLSMLSGIEADYDAELVTPAEAAALLTAAGVAGLIYTSPSHTPLRPRWRVLCALSEWHAPDARRALCGRLNAILGGVLSRESFTDSQAYYFGAVAGSEVAVALVDGAYLDLVDREPVYPATGLRIDAPHPRPAATPSDTARVAVDAVGALFTGLQDGEGRHQALLRATALLAPFVLSGDLPEADAEAYVSEAMTASGRDPNDGEVPAALAGALRYARPYEHPTGGSEFASVPAAGPAYEDPDAWRDHLMRGKPTKADEEAGRPGPVLPILANVLTALHRAPDWRGLVAYDTFGDEVMLRRAPPWETPHGFVPRPARDADAVNAVVWLQEQGIRFGSVKGVHEALCAVAETNQYSSARDYYTALVWDGKPRIDRVLIDFLGAEDTPLHRAMGAKTLISAVTRVFEPGTLVKHVLVLEGPQNIGKSAFCRALVPVARWFTDSVGDLASKDSESMLRGILIQEHAEFDKLGKADASRAKAFISKLNPRYRPAFGRFEVDRLRQCIFIATVNPGATGYLSDATGNCRYWPVACGDRRVDVAAVRAARDQLWAEAVVRYRAGEACWLESSDLDDAQRVAADDRYEDDVWLPYVAEFMATQTDWVTTSDVLQGAIRKDRGQLTRADETRVGVILMRLGCVKRQVRAGNVRPRMYRMPGEVVQLRAGVSESAA